MGIITIVGKLKSGRRIGRTIGFPTLNIPVSRVIKKDQWGVYFSLLKINGRIYPALTHLGPPKTFKLGRATCESYLLYFREKSPIIEVKKTLLLKLREIKNFPSIKELKKQIRQDVKAAKHFFGL
ncbi:MAG: hypothetical protein A3A24_03700 [Candidatus Buchananbacteria bacterium RIFCSPLOWO2_01_FULL_46_12]|uniref:riboflavin kinase n=2 Tax=Candidatus Buchananiibacteriota TaxID=1817903 RepID=A0A1G1YT51_9BACT|nr:MAG: hypothetical protein A2744_01905 [Candidatus Buchananbacteria bacterium RIFCSPHIGHO2_01_FULL_44_11]OGY55533.1 MAG: hypothetical protein A3A24_03700 [Candidatus Buchananbacteria bacterium RIFCSPLOWO2_01_FULL_46_12]